MTELENITKSEEDFLLSEECRIKERALVENLINSFVINLFEKNRDKILLKWFRYPLSDDVNHIEPFRFVIETILLRSFDFSIHPTWIEIFQDIPGLKIMRNSLDKISSKMIHDMEIYNGTYFKTVDVERSVLPSIHLRSFLFNWIFEKSINRLDLVIRIIYNVLINAIENDNTHRLFGVVRRFIITTLDTIVADQYQKLLLESKGKGSEWLRSITNSLEKKKVNSRIIFMDGILGILSYLTDERILFKKLLPQCNFRFN